MQFGDAAQVDQATTDVPWYQTLGQSLQNLATGYITVQQQQQLNQINLQRAQQGLPPLDTSQYQTGVNVGVSSSTQNTLILIAAGIGAVWLVTSLLGGRR